MLTASQFFSGTTYAICLTLFGYISNLLDLTLNPTKLGKIIAVFGSISMIGSSLAYFKAG